METYRITKYPKMPQDDGCTLHIGDYHINSRGKLMQYVSKVIGWRQCPPHQRDEIAAEYEMREFLGMDIREEYGDF